MQLGRYRVVRKLGEGGMARVLLATSATGEKVVLKVPFKQSADFAERVRDEARVGLRCSHPSVVDTLDLFEHEGKPILVVEYVEGASLQQLRKLCGPMPPGLVARIGRQVADGLAFLHEATDENDKPLNILHRDVAPGNILVTREGNAKLIDLGIARGEETKAKKTQIGTVRGTMRYLAPELLAGEKQTPATDLWALGVVLFEASLGRRAAEGDEREVLATIVRGDIAKLRPGEQIDATLMAAFGALLAPKDARLQRARAAVNVLRRIEEGLHDDGAWAAAAVERVLVEVRQRWAAEPGLEIADADTQVRAPAHGPTGTRVDSQNDDEPKTAATMPSKLPPEQPPSHLLASTQPVADPRALIEAAAGGRKNTDPRPRVTPESELGHDDGAAPTVRMQAVDFPPGIRSSPSEELPPLPPNASTEIMPAVDPSIMNPTDDDDVGATQPMPLQAKPAPRLDRTPIDRTPIDRTMQFPKPGPASSPVPPSSNEGSGASLAWRSVAAPTLLGMTATELPPAKAAAPPSTPPSSPPSSPPREPAARAPLPQAHVRAAPPVTPPKPTAPPAAKGSAPMPRMLIVDSDDSLAPEHATAAPPRLAPPPVTMPEHPPVASTSRPVDAARRPPATSARVDPKNRPPDPRALGLPTPLPSEAASAVTPLPGNNAGPEEATETAFPYGVPDSLPPSQAAELGATPRLVSDPGRPSVVETDPDVDTADLSDSPSVAMAAAKQADDDDDDSTLRVKRGAQQPSPAANVAAARLESAAEGFEEPLLSGELAWRPRSGRYAITAAAVVVAVVVAIGVLLALDVL